MAVAASPLGGLGGSEPPLPTFLLPSCLIYPSQPVSLLQRSNGCSPLSLLPCAPTGSLLPARSLHCYRTFVFDGLSIRPPVRRSVVRLSDGPMGTCSARPRPCALRCKSPSREGLNIPSLDPRCDGPKGRRRGDSRTGAGGQGMHVCIGDECRAEREREGAREGGPLSALASHFLALPACCLHLVRPAGERCIGTSASKCPFGLHCPSIKSSARVEELWRDAKSALCHGLFI